MCDTHGGWASLVLTQAEVHCYAIQVPLYTKGWTQMKYRHDNDSYLFQHVAAEDNAKHKWNGREHYTYGACAHLHPWAAPLPPVVAGASVNKIDFTQNESKSCPKSTQDTASDPPTKWSEKERSAKT